MNGEKKYAIGIDTGGTYTDAVLLEKSSGNVVATAKAPTTHSNLSIGLTEALVHVMQESAIPPSQVSFVSVSTTLATNAVVEDKGAKVGLVIIGLTKALDLPVVSVVYAKGGHKITGEEEDPLDMEALVEGIGTLAPYVDAFAVSAAMSFTNPAHEQVAEKAISMLAPGCPVFCSHEVSQRAGMKERAATTVLHARLMPVMQEFLRGVKKAMRGQGLDCPVSIVRGNASLMSIEHAVKRAADTFASGPAATSYFGTAFAPGEDALIVDVGGTTTDVTLIRGNKPTIKKGGSRIGEWETHIDAVEMFTVGIGGDSQVRKTIGGKLAVGPERVLPLCMAGEIPDPTSWLGVDDYTRLITLDRFCRDEDLENDNVLQCLKENGPTPYGELMSRTGIGNIALEERLGHLVREQKVAEIGFTPTDALHVLGELHIGNATTSTQGAEALAKQLGLNARSLSEKVLEMTRHKIETAILEHVVRKEIGGNMVDFLSRKDGMSLVHFDAALTIPLVGIGAAAEKLLPPVAQHLSTEISFPEHYEVGNALGAALLGAKEFATKQTETTEHV
ncbi:hydantoinase/oxoprolinase family protein [Desulfobaculum bizertense]|uniref:hydantoinase/oxoprolinase family protein n=1 Tax=Desulfobaculum bizertense TaxID=376490 RepID=UPI001F17D38D|nr:hydantoinase/oxoprolinase family protein [Desulfobaculum bizertense]UIJ39247.1 hydantoinase/oxoprolinase family protein [Desulfobaculum bizertense]